MDKDLIRIIIFAIGLLVFIGMIAWRYIQHEKQKKDYDDYADDSSGQAHSELGGYEDDEYETGLEESDGYDGYADASDYEEARNYQESAMAQKPDSSSAVTQTESALKKPAIIQFSIVATKREEGFNGMELFEILDDVGLEYGNLQIFERLDARRLVDYGVASMVKPGIFPSINLAAFHTPGIVFFMQPGKLDNPVAVFDDFVRTFQYVATQLGGEMWDHHRELLTDETIAQLRQSLTAS